MTLGDLYISYNAGVPIYKTRVMISSSPFMVMAWEKKTYFPAGRGTCWCSVNESTSLSSPFLLTSIQTICLGWRKRVLKEWSPVFQNGNDCGDREGVAKNWQSWELGGGVVLWPPQEKWVWGFILFLGSTHRSSHLKCHHFSSLLQTR